MKVSPDAVRRSLEANRAAYESLRGKLAVGLTESDAYRIVSEAVDEACAGQSHEFIGDFVGGVRAGAIEGPPTDYAFRPGDAFILDLSVRCGDVWSDTCRTFFFGEPTAAQRTAYAAVLACQDLGAGMIRAGVVASTVKVEMEKLLVTLGFGGKMPHHGGHLIGEKPYLRPAFEIGCDDRLEAGDVCTLEPGLYFPGEWGLRVENDYLVGEHGIERLFDYPRDIESFIIRR